MLREEDLIKLLITRTNMENKMSCVEELAELQIAVTRKERGRDKDTDNLLEEMADTIIVTHMLRLLYGISEEQLNEEIERKMKRNLDRIQNI